MEVAESSGMRLFMEVAESSGMRLFVLWGGRYCNFCIPMEGIRHWLLFWQLRQNKLVGLLYWSTTHWRKVASPEEMATWFKDRSFGDGSLLYPEAAMAGGTNRWSTTSSAR